jgi:UDP-galactopyranose mutase
MKYDYLIVGAGFAGCVLAERLASQRDKKILLIDRRDHIGGNAYDGSNSAGIRVHRYGPHLFHTNDENVVTYLSRFTDWYPYEHRVLASVNDKLVPIPVNRTTINLLFNMDYSTDEEVEKFLDREKVHYSTITNSEELVISKVGRRLFDLLYRGYTTKHWGIEPARLIPSVCGRIPIRTNDDDRYFNDRYQMMPLNGYTEMFRRMIASPLIAFEKNTEYRDVPHALFHETVFTGPIDEYFDHIYGYLPYRSLRFEFETLDTDFVQPVAQINYPNDHAYTRTTEFKHITNQDNPKTVIAKEYSLSEGDPFYPIPAQENDTLLQKYTNEATKIKHVRFVGRLGTYRYYNMDQVVAQALSTFKIIASQ